MEELFGKPLQPFYGFACRMWKLFGKKISKTAYFNKLKERFEILYPNYKKDELVRIYICYKCSITIGILCGAFVIGAICFATGNEKIASIEREDYWGEEKEEVLVMASKEEEQEVTVPVPAKAYQEEEIVSVLEKLAGSLEQTILKNNESLDCVKTDLNLVTAVPDTSVEVQWEMDKEGYLDYDGTLIPGAVTQDSVIVNLVATLSYNEQSCSHSFAIHLKKPELTEGEALKLQLSREIEQLNASSATASALQLPTQLNGNRVSFYRENGKTGGKLMLLLGICSIILFFLKDEDMKKRLEERRKQLFLDYSEIVSKLTLLLGAGMTIRGALDKLASDYDKKRKAGKQVQRYAYDEIVYVCREMQGGVSERAGIEMLGKRCQIPCYMKLCSLLQQNLKKGSSGLAEALSYEAGAAFEERKNFAKKQGEEAGTKLLFPMILMLVIVMVILIVPAMMSF